MSVAGLLLKGFGPTTGSVPAQPTLAVADNADGTGATATITNSDAVTNTVYYSQYTGAGTGAVSTWTSGGSRTGVGTVSLSLAVGYYWAYVISADGSETASEPVLFVVTSGDDSIFKQCIDAVVARVQSLSLTSVASASIVARKVPSDYGIGSEYTIKYPAIVVSNGASESQSPGAGSVSKDDVGYPVDVGILATDEKELTANHDKYLRWREQIRRSIHNQRIPGVPTEVYTAFVEPRTITGYQQWRNGFYASFLTIRFMSRESRGLT